MSKRRRKTPKKGNPAKRGKFPNAPKTANNGDKEKKNDGKPRIFLSRIFQSRIFQSRQWKIAIEVVGLIANLATIFAIGLTCFQICIGNWQFDKSGPDYTWFMLDRIASNTAVEKDGISTQTTFPMVMANSGRTEDTVISLSRDTQKAENMTICIPEFDGKGEYREGSAILNDRGSLSLAPGESRLLFVVSPRAEATRTGRANGAVEYRSDAFELTGRLTVYSASGRTFEAAKVEPERRIVDHYQNLPGFDRAKNACMTLVNGES